MAWDGGVRRFTPAQPWWFLPDVKEPEGCDTRARGAAASAAWDAAGSGLRHPQCSRAEGTWLLPSPACMVGGFTHLGVLGEGSRGACRSWSRPRAGGIAWEQAPQQGRGVPAVSSGSPGAGPGGSGGGRRTLAPSKMPRGRRSNPALPSRRRPACSDPRRLPGTRGRGRQRAERRPPRPPPRLLLLPALLPAATQPPSPTAGPASAHLPQPPGPFGAASCRRSALPGTPPPARRPPGQRWGAAGGPESLPCFSPNPLLPLPIQAHTNHVIVLCFRRQFLDSDMPRYYLFPLVFFPPPLCSSPLSPPHLSTLTPAGGGTWVSSPPPPHLPPLTTSRAPLSFSLSRHPFPAGFAVCLDRDLAPPRSRSRWPVLPSPGFGFVLAFSLRCSPASS